MIAAVAVVALFVVAVLLLAARAARTVARWWRDEQWRRTFSRDLAAVTADSTIHLAHPDAGRSW